jgi:hypothetical protein
VSTASDTLFKAVCEARWCEKSLGAEKDWDTGGGAGRPGTAPPDVLAAVMRRMDAMLPKRLAEARTAAARLASSPENHVV